MKSPSGLLLIFPLLLLCQYSSVVALFSANTTTTTETAGTSLKAAPQHQQKRFNKSSSVSAVFIFGDSTVDPGNNNYIPTIFKSNFPPYGKDFPNQIPTGRFTNGKLVTDFLAGYLGIKEAIPPYLDPTLGIDDLTTGVSFASAGAGFDPLTAQLSGVIPIQQQLHYFREYKTLIEKAIGKEKAKALIENAFYLISCGTNDHIVTYFNTPLRQYTFSISEYQQFLLKMVHQFLQSLIAEGARKIVVVGLPPMGCLPVVITLMNSNMNNRKCIEKISSAARKYNQELQRLLNAIRLQKPSLKLVYGDLYTPVNDMITNPTKYGFTEINSGCCGSGLVEVTKFLCNLKSATCPDDSKYIFWDSVHPTQATCYYVFKAMSPLFDYVAS